MYRSCDDVWTFVLSNASVRVDEEPIAADRIKIVACNSKRPNLDPAGLGVTSGFKKHQR